MSRIRGLTDLYNTLIEEIIEKQNLFIIEVNVEEKENLAYEIYVLKELLKTVFMLIGTNTNVHEE